MYRFLKQQKRLQTKLTYTYLQILIHLEILVTELLIFFGKCDLRLTNRYLHRI